MNRVWSVDYGAYVSNTYASESIKAESIKLSLNKCVILINRLGFIYLMQNNRRVKKLSTKEYLKYKNYVKKVVNEGYPLD